MVSNSRFHPPTTHNPDRTTTTREQQAKHHYAPPICSKPDARPHHGAFGRAALLRRAHRLHACGAPGDADAAADGRQRPRHDLHHVSRSSKKAASGDGMGMLVSVAGGDMMSCSAGLSWTTTNQNMPHQRDTNGQPVHAAGGHARDWHLRRALVLTAPPPVEDGKLDRSMSPSDKSLGQAMMLKVLVHLDDRHLTVIFHAHPRIRSTTTSRPAPPPRKRWLFTKRPTASRSPNRHGA